MKERPILFSGAMVRAILAGTKAQTRRIVNPQPDGQPVCDPSDGAWYVDGGMWCRRCPYGAPGDRLWVRETFGPSMSGGVAFRADWPEGAPFAKWKPAIHMPRALSRIDLEITAVRVERLHDITEEDARAEGVDPDRLSDVVPSVGRWHRDAFRLLWDTINGDRAPWESNPWLWVVDFKRVRP